MLAYFYVYVHSKVLIISFIIVLTILLLSTWKIGITVRGYQSHFGITGMGWKTGKCYCQLDKKKSERVSTPAGRSKEWSREWTQSVIIRNERIFENVVAWQKILLWWLWRRTDEWGRANGTENANPHGNKSGQKRKWALLCITIVMVPNFFKNKWPQWF